jgi:hypothetical protein
VAVGQSADGQPSSHATEDPPLDRQARDSPSSPSPDTPSSPSPDTPSSPSPDTPAAGTELLTPLPTDLTSPDPDAPSPAATALAGATEGTIGPAAPGPAERPPDIAAEPGVDAPVAATAPVEVDHAFPAEVEPLPPTEPMPVATTVLPPPVDLERRHTLTFVGLFAAVIVIGLVAYSSWIGLWAWPFGSGAAAECLATTPTPTAAAVADTSVRVFNATNRRGLALNVARDLQHRGFLVAMWDNDPTAAGMKPAAEVRYGPDGLLHARTVAAQVNGPVELVLQETRQGSTVDLVLGTTFQRLRADKDAARLLTVPAPVPGSCPSGAAQPENSVSTPGTKPGGPSATQ